MMKIRMLVSAILVFTAVTGALAFKPLGAGNIYCFADTDIASVNSSLPCSNAAQPPSTRIDWRVSNDPSHSTADPCPNPSTQTPFNGSVGGFCTQMTPGVDRFTVTQL